MLQVGNQLLMFWIDRFDEELGYQLQRRADGVAYFLTGTSGTLYRVTLP